MTRRPRPRRVGLLVVAERLGVDGDLVWRRSRLDDVLNGTRFRLFQVLDVTWFRSCAPTRGPPPTAAASATPHASRTAARRERRRLTDAAPPEVPPRRSAGEQHGRVERADQKERTGSDDRVDPTPPAPRRAARRAARSGSAVDGTVRLQTPRPPPPPQRRAAAGPRVTTADCTGGARRSTIGCQSLSAMTANSRCNGRPPSSAGSSSASAAMPSRLCAPSRIVSGAAATMSSRPGQRTDASPRRTASSDTGSRSRTAARAASAVPALSH